MTASITALYAAIFALLVMALAINVTVHRLKLHISVGDGGNAQMLRMIRLHGNAVEYVPITLLLMLTYELNGGSHTILHVAGLAMLTARVVHAWGMSLSDIPNKARKIGQSLTWLTVIALAVLNLWKVI